MQVKLRMTGKQRAMLWQYLFPGDGLEAASLLVCGRHFGTDSHVLTVQRVENVPHAWCKRHQGSVTWPTESALQILPEVVDKNLALLKVHSHPWGVMQFSSTDNMSDREFYCSVYGWTDDENPHASLVMFQDGTLIGRAVLPDGKFEPLSLITVAGTDLLFFSSDKGGSADLPNFTQRHGQAFGTGTVQQLKQLSIAVVGCSGTGSVVIEQLARLGVGTLVLIDPDCIEERNLNRILNSQHADIGMPKVEVQARAVRGFNLGTTVVPLQRNLADLGAIAATAACDIVFGCMDGAEGRYLLNRLSAFYCLPYFDVGVRLE